MIVWSEKLYIGEQAEKNFRKVRKKLESGRLLSEFFLITEPSNQSNLLDILPASELLFPYNKRRRLLVYGIARGRAETEGLVLSMLEDVYQKTGGVCCKEYFKSE